MQTLRALLQLTRLDSSTLGFLAIFTPLFVRSRDLVMSFEQAIPLLFICMCSFIANDLDDVERDKVNHPERPLPARRLSPTTAAVLYFVCLAAALFSTRQFVEPVVAFWYYALVALSVSYSHVVDRLPSIKSLYVAVAISVPVLIVAKSYPDEPTLYRVAASVFLFALGREICMDIKDRTGDPVSSMHRIPQVSLALFAFALQMIGLMILPIDARRFGDLVGLAVLILLLVAAAVYWFRLAERKPAIVLMKIQFFVGLYFLT